VKGEKPNLFFLVAVGVVRLFYLRRELFSWSHCGEDSVDFIKLFFKAYGISTISDRTFQIVLACNKPAKEEQVSEK